MNRKMQGLALAAAVTLPSFGTVYGIRTLAAPPPACVWDGQGRFHAPVAIGFRPR